MFKVKKKKEGQLGSAFDNLYTYNFVANVGIDEQFMDLAERLIINRPIIANFEEIKSSSEIDRAVAFLSGIVYALNGEVHCIGSETFLFATANALKDGSINHYLRDVSNLDE